MGVCGMRKELLAAITFGALALASSSGMADTLPLTTVINGGYTFTGSGSVTVSEPALATGSTTVVYPSTPPDPVNPPVSASYFDYLYKFTIQQDSYLSLEFGPTGGSNLSELHVMFYHDVAPVPGDDDLFTGSTLTDQYTNPMHPNTNLIDIGNNATFDSATSTNNVSSGGTLTLAPAYYDSVNMTNVPLVSLAGEYWLRVFGTLDPSQTSVALAGKITAVAATPVPAALPLFLTAIGGLGFLARRRQKAAAVAA